MPSLTLRLGKIQELLILSILVLRVITITVLIAVGDSALARIEELIIDIGAEDSSVKVPARKAFAVKPILEVSTTQKADITPTPEAPVVTSEMRQLLTQLVPVLFAGTSVPPLVSESNSVTIVETESGSAPPTSTPAMDILEELTL